MCVQYEATASKGLAELSIEAVNGRKPSLSLSKGEKYTSIAALILTN